VVNVLLFTVTFSDDVFSASPRIAVEKLFVPLTVCAFTVRPPVPLVRSERPCRFELVVMPRPLNEELVMFSVPLTVAFATANWLVKLSPKDEPETDDVPDRLKICTPFSPNSSPAFDTLTPVIVRFDTPLPLMPICAPPETATLSSVVPLALMRWMPAAQLRFEPLERFPQT